MATTGRARKQTTVLIVEDHAPMRAMLRAFLQASFPACAIFEAENGARALEICAMRRPQLVLMDVCLPDANGIELTEHLRVSMPEARVIVISYLSGAIYVDAARAAGAFAYVLKDHLPTDLIPVVTSALRMAPAAGWR